ncbi:hypothetical protein ACQJBY_071028 [Aegilops geniculata]
MLQLEASQLVGEHLPERRHALGLQRQHEREGAVLAGRVHHVHEAAVVHEGRPHERRRAPPEVGVGERHAHPADGAEVRARDAAARQVHRVHALQVVHQRPRVVAALARRRARQPRGVDQRAGHHLLHRGRHGRADHRVAEVPRRELRVQARAHVHHGVEPRLGRRRERAGAAHALPHQGHDGAERGRAEAPGLERAHLALSHRDDGARVRGGRHGVHRLRLGLVLRVVVQHGARLRRARGEQRVVEAGRHGRRACAAGDARPRLEEVGGAARVDDGVVHGLAEHQAAAAEARDLHEQQGAGRVGRRRGRHEQVPHLAARHELVHQLLERVVVGAGRDEDHALAGAVHLDAAGGVEAQAAGERVEGDERPGEAVPHGVGGEEARVAVGAEEVDRGGVAPPPGEVEVGEPDAAPRRRLGRDDQLRREHLHHRHCQPS